MVQQPDTEDHDHEKTMVLKASLVLFAFGLMVLGYLVAIGRADWFVVRPVSTASAAMSKAGGYSGEDDPNFEKQTLRGPTAAQQKTAEPSGNGA